MSHMLRAALDYASRGWPIFPLAPNSKEPAIPTRLGGAGVLDATTDAAKIKKWWTDYPDANIGLDVGGAGMMVLDLDPGHDPAELKKAVGPYDSPLRQRTPRGGSHLFYAIAEGEIIPPTASKVAKGVDVRSFHSYVVLAPSYVDDGKAKGSYEWDADEFPLPRPPFRPDRIKEAAGRAKEKDKDADRWLVPADMPEHVARATDWLKNTAKIAIQGQGGDHVAYATAAMMKSFAISPERALDLMLEHWNPRCQPPWGEDEIDHLTAKVDHAYSYNTSPPGNMTDAYARAKAAEGFQPVGRVANDGYEVSAGRFRIVDRGGIDSVADPEWLVNDLLPAGGFGLLVGQRGSFKSFVALDIAASISTGQGRIFNPRRRGNTLLAVGEGRSGIKQRVQAWEKHRGLKADGLYLVDPVPLVSRREDWEMFTKLALEMQPDGYDLIVLDTVGRAMAGVNENAQEHASAFTQMVDHIQREIGCTVLGLHHAGHGTEKRARGSSVFEADVDTVLFIEREDKSYTIDLHMTKQKDAPEWEQPKRLKLVECGKSIVPVEGEDKLATAVKVVSRDTKVQGFTRKSGPKTAVAIELVDNAAWEILSGYKNATFSTNKLARMIAHKMGAGVSESTVRQQYLKHYLKCDQKFKTFACYDAAGDQWRSVG